MGGVGRGFGKLLLFGEHAAVYGHPAVGKSLPERTTVRLTGAPRPEWDLRSIPAGDAAQVRRLLDRMERIVPGLAATGRCRIEIHSNVTRSAGFGSSAALCAALSVAVLSHVKPGRRAADPTEAWRVAHDAERLFHGTPSGIDTGLSLLRGLRLFRPRPPELPESIPLVGAPLWLVVGAVPRDDACRNLIAGLAGRMKAGDAAVTAAIETLGGLATAAGRELASRTPGAAGPAPRIGILADQAMERLRGLGLSTAALDTLLDAGKQEGALGGKLSGAGGGGAFFLVAGGRRAAEEIARRLRREAEKEGIQLLYPVRVIRT